MKRLFVIAVALFYLIQCDQAPFKTSDQPEPEPPDLSAINSKVTEADNQFGLDLFGRLVAEEPGENIFISPVSIATALAMTANGADNNTKTQIYQTLGFGGMDRDEINESFKTLLEYLVTLDPKVATKIANSIWYNNRYSFAEAFLQTNQTFFDARISGLDFSDDGSADIINGWVSENTNDLIKNIIEKPIDPSIVMFLINAIYFKGTWTYQFETDSTETRNFTNQDGSISEVDMMRGTFLLNRFKNDDLSMVELPYGNEKYSMLLLLPNLSTDINQLVAGLNHESLNSWVDGLSEDTTILGLPRFKMEYEKKLNDILIDMGMPDAFIEGLADFSLIRPENDLFISKVKHKSFVEVNEEGTEAAAVTVVVIATSSNGGPLSFYVDRPFLFLIRDRESGTILFIGKAGQM